MCEWIRISLRAGGFLVANATKNDALYSPAFTHSLIYSVAYLLALPFSHAFSHSLTYAWVRQVIQGLREALLRSSQAHTACVWAGGCCSLKISYRLAQMKGSQQNKRHTDTHTHTQETGTIVSITLAC